MRDIAEYEWHDCNGNRTKLLTDEEVSNLTIAKGTLTTEERHIINNHIAVTIKMLDQLPFPKHLRNVRNMRVVITSAWMVKVIRAG